MMAKMLHLISILDTKFKGEWPQIFLVEHSSVSIPFYSFICIHPNATSIYKNWMANFSLKKYKDFLTSYYTYNKNWFKNLELEIKGRVNSMFQSHHHMGAEPNYTQTRWHTMWEKLIKYVHRVDIFSISRPCL